jgi:glycerol-3-phosphate dehydrogenase
VTGGSVPEFDVAVVGAGVVGCAIARLLTSSGASVVVFDRAPDVGDGTSKANTAIVHTGFDTMPGSLESRLVARGHDLLAEYTTAAGIAVERTGALLVSWDDEQEAALPGLLAKAVANGCADARIRTWVRGPGPACISPVSGSSTRGR